VPGLYRVSDDGYLDYFFHGGQWRAWESSARFVVVLSGTQGGKTVFGPPWLFREIQRRGPGDYLVATPSFPLLYVKALPEFLQLFERTLGLGRFVQSPVRRFEFSRDGLARTFGNRLAEPTTIYFGHASDPDSLEAATYKGAWLDEVGQKRFKLGSWEAVQRRLSIYEGRVLFTTTPYYLGWFKDRVADPAERGAAGYELVRFESIENPAFPRGEWERVRRELPRWKFDLFYRAIWTRPAGLIYDNFTAADRIKRRPVPKEWRRYVGIDFGGVNMAALFYAEVPNTKPRRYWVYREYFPQEKRAISDHVRAITAGEPPGLIAVGGAPGEGQWRREMRRAGLPVRRPSVSDVEIGIGRVYAAHQRGQIVVFDDLARYLDEKAAYSRALDEMGNPTMEIEDKGDYHLMDCERYLWSLLGGEKSRRAARSRQGA